MTPSKVRRILVALFAINMAVITGVLLAVNAWLHPRSMNSWISAAAFTTFVCGLALGYGVGFVHGLKERS